MHVVAMLVTFAWLVRMVADTSYRPQVCSYVDAKYTPRHPTFVPSRVSDDADAVTALDRLADAVTALDRLADANNVCIPTETNHSVPMVHGWVRKQFDPYSPQVSRLGNKSSSTTRVC